MLVGVIYRFLAESNPEYADFLHDEGYNISEKRFKLFTFSQLMAEHRHVTGDQIHFRSTLTWFVSSPVEQFLSHFADTLLSEGILSLGAHQLKIRDVTIPRIPRFHAEMEFRCLSPIVMSTVHINNGQRHMHYCLPDDPISPNSFVKTFSANIKLFTDTPRKTIVCPSNSMIRISRESADA